MKINRLQIEGFAIEEYPPINNDRIDGDDLLLKGGNRSGKTLTVNALLYAFFGPRATLGVAPGRKSEIEIRFDNDHVLNRGSGGREYIDENGPHEKDEADDRIQTIIGDEETVTLQFVHSETDKLPLSRLTDDQLITRIRRVRDSELQEEIEEYTEEKEELEREIEQVERTELKPLRRELDDLDMGQFERRLEKIEHLQTLINSGRIETIKQRLLENEEINEKLEDLYNRKRTIEQDLRKKNRKLREQQRYTQRVNELIINAIDELSCPVCDNVVEEDLAERRLQRGQCPQCGRERSLEQLKSNLREKVNNADDSIEDLKHQIEGLEEEKSEITDEIESLQSSVPELSELNNLTKHTLEDKDYDIDAVAAETEERLQQHRDAVERLRTKKEQLEQELEEVEASLDELKESHEYVSKRIEELQTESFEEIVADFQELWSTHYQSIADDLGQEIHIEPDGSVQVPGNDGPREYDQLSTGETRLLNLAFAYTIANHTDNLNVVVLDEPFANLEQDKRDSAIKFIKDADTQFIITTSNEEIERYFGTNQIETLETMPIQLTWDDYND